MDFKSIITNILNKLSFLDSQQQLSLTNLSVMVFCGITAFRGLFGNLSLHLGADIQWVVQPIDFASTLPVIYSLWNYNEKRKSINSSTNQTGSTNDQTK